MKYKDAARKFELAGPTSFKPIIDKAIEIVERQRGYHILWILCDGQVTHERETISTCIIIPPFCISNWFVLCVLLVRPSVYTLHAFPQIARAVCCLYLSVAEAIVEASKYPLSIICIGIGDGPWEAMQDFDDKLPAREFDNVRHELSSRLLICALLLFSSIAEQALTLIHALFVFSPWSHNAV